MIYFRVLFGSPSPELWLPSALYDINNTSCCCDKTLDKSSSGRNGVFDSPLESPALTAGKAWQLEYKAAGYTVSEVRKERDEHWC